MFKPLNDPRGIRKLLAEAAYEDAMTVLAYRAPLRYEDAIDRLIEQLSDNRRKKRPSRRVAVGNEGEKTMEWQPIDTAPKETEVLVWFGPAVGVKSATYIDKDNDDVWFWCVTDGKFDPHPVRRYCAPYPTHWMPLPLPPSAA